MKKFSLLVCLLTLLLCACEVNPTAATTDAQPTEATSAATETTKVTTAQEPEIPRYTVSFTTDALAEVLGNIEDKARNGEQYSPVYEVAAKEDNEILLQIYCDAEGYTFVTRVTYHGKAYDVKIGAFYGGFLDILYLPDLLIFGEHGASAPGDSYYFFYDGGMCGYNGKELLLDGVNDEVVSALRAPAVDFTLQDGVLYYAKYYHYGIYQSVDFLLEFADTPDELYSEEGTLTFADGKLTMTSEKTTTIEDFAARYYDKYNVTNFADLMQAFQNPSPQEPEIPRYTVAMNSEAVSMFLLKMQLKAEKGESYPSVYEIVAEENSNFVLRISCTPDGNTAENTVTQVEYYGETYPIDMRALGGNTVSVFCLPDLLLVHVEEGGSAPSSKYYFFYDGGMCGYNGKELLDGVNDEVVNALRAPAVDFTLRDGVLHYAKYYHYAIQQADAMVLKFADTPDELYSEEGTITFADGKLTMTHEKTTTIEDFAARYYDRYNVTNFADLMQAMKNR